jgi:hypothetical protein
MNVRNKGQLQPAGQCRGGSCKPVRETHWTIYQLYYNNAYPPVPSRVTGRFRCYCEEADIDGDVITVAVVVGGRLDNRKKLITASVNPNNAAARHIDQNTS